MSKRPDLVVVGGGLIGLVCGWRAAQAGLSVTVVDRGPLEGKASSVAAGMLAAATEAKPGELDFVRLALASAALYPSFVAELEASTGSTVGYEETGTLQLAFSEAELDAYTAHGRSLSAEGLVFERYEREDVLSQEASINPEIAGALWFPDEAQVDPPALVAALTEAFSRAGGRLIEDEVVEGVWIGAGTLRGVRTARGEELLSEAVLLASGAEAGLTPWLPEDSRPPVHPVKGQLLWLEAPEPPLRSVVRRHAAYIVPRADGRLIIGATSEEVGFDVELTDEALRALLGQAEGLVPGVSRFPLRAQLAGLRPGAPKGKPILGRSHDIDGLFLAVGHYRNGVVLAPITAAIITAALTGAEAPVPADAFAPLAAATVAHHE